MAEKGLVAEALEYDSMLRAILYQYTRNGSDIEELLQETYARLLRVDAAVRARIQSVPAFAAKVARNVATDWCRRRNIAPIELLPDMEVLNCADECSVDDQIHSAQRLELLAAAMKSLPPRCRQILELRRLEGLGREEIARRLSITTHIVHNDLKQGLKLLRLWMKSPTDKEAS